MRRVLTTLFLLTWALWFGGLVFLFLTVTTLFHQSHQLGATAAPVVFLSFEKYHVTLAAVCFILCLPRLQPPSHRAWRWIFILVIIGGVTSLITSQFLTPRINLLHLQGQINTPEFRHLHGISFALYLCESLAMLLVGVIFPGAENK